MDQPYLHNSSHKEYIRDKWVEFASLLVNPEEGLSVITFPAEEMHDLRLFVEKGLISWTETETGSFYITKGKIICFEKITKYYLSLRKSLTNATVESLEIGRYLRQKYHAIMGGDKAVFPVDVINLDYDGNISKSWVPIEEIINLVFEFQALHKKNFSLFLTWPYSEDEDEGRYKELLKKVIGDNLGDPRAISFKEIYEAGYPNVDELDYNNLSIIGISKVIIQKAARHKYNLHKNEFFIYGEENRRPMFSILLNFDFQTDTPEHAIYTNCVTKSLEYINDLRNPPVAVVAEA